ncbi:MAG: hypothetical protein PHW96_02690 [Candidatus Nanoarchaeia archaeon]|nr:hypothetical protein [Candidatus Nanoarchaeia archaeon]
MALTAKKVKRYFSSVFKPKNLSIFLVLLMLGSTLVIFTYTPMTLENDESQKAQLIVYYGEGNILPIDIEPLNQTASEVLIQKLGKVKFSENGTVECVNNLCGDDFGAWKFTVNSLEDEKNPANYMITGFDVLVLRYVPEKEIPQGLPKGNITYK